MSTTIEFKIRLLQEGRSASSRYHKQRAFHGVRRGYHHSLRGGIYERQMLSPSRLMKLISVVGFVVVTYNLYCFLHSKQHSGALKVRVIKHNLRPQTAASRSIDDLDLAKFYATSLEVLTTLADMRHSSTSDNLLPNATTHNSVITDAAGEDQQALHLWSAQLLSKLHKLHTLSKLGGIFLYHMRKAAGTTIRDMLTDASIKWGVPFYESEGPTLNRLFLEENLLLVTSLRNPIERIFSLYWYEHVSWYDGVLHETHKCKTLNAWIEGWRDGSKWKTDFMLQNPGSVYVEVENYYVKALSGWVGPAPVGEKDFEAAISALKRFDVVFVTEWINREDQMLAMNSLFSIPVDKMPVQSTDHFQGKRNSQTLGHQVKGDRSARLRLGPTLVDDQVSFAAY